VSIELTHVIFVKQLNPIGGIIMAENKATMSGLTDAEAKEFHAIFVSSMSGFFGIVIFAHLLAWFWRPWF
jgi:light-harvesting complex 1 beta chain